MTKSRSVGLLDAAPPRVLHCPETRSNAWEDVSDLCAAYGLILDGWQEDVLRAGLAERSDGRWAARNVGVSIARQNGKTQIIAARVLAGLFLFDEKLIQVSAQRQDTAREVFFRLVEIIEGSDSLNERIDFIAYSETREYIKTKSGQRVEFRARGASTSRGKSYDCLMMDEAQIISESVWQSVYPTMSARPNAQVWLLGTPPTAQDDGEVFGRFRQAGLEGRDSRTAWIEWGAESGDDLDDPEVWRRANPAYGDRILHDAIAAERAVMSDAQFAMERLGMWEEAVTSRVIDEASWLACRDELSQAVTDRVMAVDVAPDRSVASVAGAGRREDGRIHVELAESRTSVDWVAPWLAERFKAKVIGAVVVDKASAAASLVPALRREKVRVIETSSSDMAAACGQFYDEVMAGGLVHIGQPQLDAALAGARKRSMLNGAAWGWNRKSTSTDITPLVAATLAAWGIGSSTKPSKKRKRKVVVMQ